MVPAEKRQGFCPDSDRQVSRARVVGDDEGTSGKQGAQATKLSCGGNHGQGIPAVADHFVHNIAIHLPAA
jgi:hypothetical protein